MSTAIRQDRASRGVARISASLWRRAWLRATLTLTPPLAWILVTAFWTVNPFTNVLEHNWSFTNFDQLFTGTYATIIGRTLELAALVTVTDARSEEHTSELQSRPHLV